MIFCGKIFCGMVSVKPFEHIFEIAMYKTEASVVSSASALLIVSDKGVLLSARKCNSYILCGKVNIGSAHSCAQHLVCQCYLRFQSVMQIPPLFLSLLCRLRTNWMQQGKIKFIRSSSNWMQ